MCENVLVNIYILIYLFSLCQRLMSASMIFNVNSPFSNHITSPISSP